MRHEHAQHWMLVFGPLPEVAPSLKLSSIAMKEGRNETEVHVRNETYHNMIPVGHPLYTPPWTREISRGTISPCLFDT